MDEKIVISAQGLGKQVQSGERTLQLLSGIDLAIEAGAAVAIIGASGSGKSTLLGLLAGLDLPTEGSLTLFGASLTELDEDARARLRAGDVGFVFQSFQLIAGLTALENVQVPLELLNQGGDIRQQAVDVLTKVGLAERLDHFPNQLSGGEQQRVALARAFVTHPKVLFADEPTGNLDQETGQQIIELLFEMQSSQGATLILVTHDPALAARCGSQYRLESGRFVAQA